MKNKTIFLISLIVGVLGLLGIIFIAYLDGENISVNLRKNDGIIISSSILFGFFIVTFITLKLLYRTNLIRKILFGLIIISSGLLYYGYQNGLIGSHTFENLFSEKIINHYNGDYIYDKSKITNPNLIKSVNIAEKRNQPLVLSIDGSGASLLGYQYYSRIRNRFFTVCLSGKDILLHNGGLGYTNHDYCKIPHKSKFTLKIKPIDETILFCENCEDEDFPKYWKKINKLIN